MKRNNFEKITLPRVMTVAMMALAMAMTIAIPKANTVYAEEVAENVLVLNEGYEVVSEDGSTVSLTFTAPSDGYYYFASEGYDDMYGYFESGSISAEDDDDGVHSNFLIKQRLSAGQVCTISVREYDGYSFQTVIYAMDQSLAEKKYYIYDYNYSNYAYIGEEYVLAVDIRNYAGKKINQLDNGYSLKWQKSDDMDYIYEGINYTIASVSENDIYDSESNDVYYMADLYKGEVIIDSAHMVVVDAAKSVRSVEGQSVFVNEGDQVSLVPLIYDYYDNPVNVDEQEIYYEWYKNTYEGTVQIDNADLSYDFEITEDDMYDESKQSYTYFSCEVYVDDEYVGSADFYLYNKNTFMYANDQYLYSTVGETLTLTAEVFNYNDEQIVLNEEEYIINWYKFNYESEEFIYLASGLSYTIEEISESDLLPMMYSAGNYYLCDIQRVNDLYPACYARFEIYDTANIYYTSYGNFKYCEPGENVTLEAVAYDYEYKPVDVAKEGLEVCWYRVNKYDSSIDEYLSEGATLALTSVTEEDFEYYYYFELYRNDTFITGGRYILVKKGDAVIAKEVTYYVNAGESLTLTVELEDYYGNPIAASDDDFNFEWYKRDGSYDWNYLGDENSYTISSVEESDYNVDGKNMYECDISDVYGNYIGMAIFNIYDKSLEPETTTKAPETTKATETTTVAPTTKAPEATTIDPATMKKPRKATIKKVFAKKKASKAVKVTLKKVKGATGYQVQISKGKKFTKKNILVKKNSKKINITLKNKKLKNKKKLFVRARAFVKTSSGVNVYGKWSKIKKVRIK